MEEMMLLMAKMLPEEKIITALREAIDKYDIALTNEDKSDASANIAFYSMLFSIKKGTEKEDIIKTLNSLKEHRTAVNLFKDKNN